jgi:hypothetical protein
MKPRFAAFPAEVALDTTGSINVSVTGAPRGKGYCATPFEIYHTDSEPVRTTDSNLCGWVITRTWTIRPRYQDCLLGVPRNNPLSTSRDQLLSISDVTAPVFVTTPEPQVRIPFFSNYRSTPTIPVVEDRASATFFQTLGLVTSTTLTSSDSAFIRATESDNAALSRQDGLAHFTRTWTIKDACQNTHQAVQSIIIEHPDQTVQPVQPLLAGAWQMAADVVQLQDPCRPGKAVAFGDKDYEPRAPFDQCSANHWDEAGCRLQSRGVGNAATVTVFEIFPFKPHFLTFPEDAHITTEDPHSQPSFTGEPTGAAFAATPMEIYFTGSCQNMSLLLAPCFFLRANV